MKRLTEYFGRDSAYWGDKGEWSVVATQHRDSDCLTRSNFRCLARDLHKASGGVIVGFEAWGNNGDTEISGVLHIVEASHWAVGWVQYLVVAPEACNMVALAEKLIAKLDDYPVLDEEDLSRLEDQEAEGIWRDCYRPKDRIEYVRGHRYQFEFQGFADLLGCIRGKYFSGYASELIG